MNDTFRSAGAPLWTAILLLLLALVLAARSLVPPEPAPLDAPAHAFSGLRAAQQLRTLLGDETPHPVGSAANRAVRDRLIGELTKLGLRPEVQRAVGCSHKWPVCANVENVVAELPGETADAVAIMAHYDSVPHSPGAADDGSGVVTLLESARVLRESAPARNRVILLFTDAEEMGLLGAEAFFAEHPLASSVKAVINVEGSGSGGPSLLLRTSASGGHLLRAYRAAAANPVAFSYSQEVFARMPNDTDFTVPDRAGVASIDFAFAFEYNHYHTPLDTVANLDPGSLQHHGDNVLPLVRALSAQDLSETEPNFAYLTIGQQLWITWPSGWTLLLAVLALMLLGAAIVRASAGGAWKQIAVSVLLGVLVLALGMGTCYGALWIAERIVGTTVSFPANPWPWRVLMFAGAIGPACALAWAGRRIGFWPRYLGAWLLLGILALALAIAAPLAANLLLLPVLVAAILASLVLFLPGVDRPLTRTLAAAAALFVNAYVLLGIAVAMEETQGLNLAPVVYANLVLVAPALLAFGSAGRPTILLFSLLPVAWIWAAVTPLYSAWRPQHVSLFYVLDLDRQQAHWSAITDNPLPAPIVDALGGTVSEQPLVPWTPENRFPAAPAPVVAVPPPDLSAVRSGQLVRLEVRSLGSGDFTQLVVPATTGITAFSVAGHPLPIIERDGWVRANFYANGSEPVIFELTLTTPGDVEAYVVDGSHTLPAAAAPISAARGSLAVPRHQGDQQYVYRTIRF
ncbi:MAG: M20/M25/M40 family metallo-hydrolase [Pseudomonadales bacterium]